MQETLGDGKADIASYHVKLPNDCSIYQVSNLREELYAAVEKKTDFMQQQKFIIDLEKVEKIDAAFLQLLVSLNKAVKKINGVLSICNPSHKALTLIKLLGFDVKLPMQSLDQKSVAPNEGS